MEVIWVHVLNACSSLADQMWVAMYSSRKRASIDRDKSDWRGELVEGMLYSYLKSLFEERITSFSCRFRSDVREHCSYLDCQPTRGQLADQVASCCQLQNNNPWIRLSSSSSRQGRRGLSLDCGEALPPARLEHLKLCQLTVLTPTAFLVCQIGTTQVHRTATMI